MPRALNYRDLDSDGLVKVASQRGLYRKEGSIFILIQVARGFSQVSRNRANAKSRVSNYIKSESSTR